MVVDSELNRLVVLQKGSSVNLTVSIIFLKNIIMMIFAKKRFLNIKSLRKKFTVLHYTSGAQPVSLELKSMQRDTVSLETQFGRH